ncbi:unnamed protein product, partial [Discosporangium mesarthrocarpum]
MSPQVECKLDDAINSFIEYHRRKSKSQRPKGEHSDGKLHLSIFDIPLGLLVPLEERAQKSEGEKNEAPLIVNPGTVEDGGTVRGLTCRSCSLTFDDHLQQQAHFKAALHITNLHRRLAGKLPVRETGMVEEEEEAGVLDDGRDGEMVEEGEKSSADSDDENLTSILEADLVETSGKGDLGVRSDGVRFEFSQREGSRLTFTRPGSAWSFSLSSAALNMQRGNDAWEQLGMLFGDRASNRMWGVLILRSGRFAGAVFEGQSVLCHKVFRRYTIRAKRGGSQSSYDSGGRKAQSAGAALRRYGEQSLKEDVQALLQKWEGVLQ